MELFFYEHNRSGSAIRQGGGSGGEHAAIGLLLRHASQNSLDESSQRNQSNLPEEDDYKPPYKNTMHFEKAFGILDTLRKYVELPVLNGSLFKMLILM